MRMTTPVFKPIIPTQASSLLMHGTLDEQFEITALEHDIVRVQFRPDGNHRLNRTWMITDANGDVPREGRNRNDMTRFTRPEFSIAADDDWLEMATGSLAVRAHQEDVYLQWLVDGVLFAADVVQRGYPYDRSGDVVQHFMTMQPDELYYGFGERTGPLNKRGMRMEMRDLDSLGYNAERTDPLYKHFPFYITFNPALNIAYGLLYDNLATTVFDMGREIDAIWEPYRKYEAIGGDIDYYMISGFLIPLFLFSLIFNF
ncbi:MAG: hypothetical protein AAF787_21645 [Chloroflexota bacterium]